MFTKKTEPRTSLPSSVRHADAVRHAAVEFKELGVRGVIEAMIEGNEVVWQAVVAEYKRLSKKRRR